MSHTKKPTIEKIILALLGLLAGWRLWKRLWGPRVVKDKGAR